MVNDVVRRSFHIRSIKRDEVNMFSAILQEAAIWLQNQGMEMWTLDQVSAESLLLQYSQEEMFIGFIGSEPSAAMILQTEDPLLWPNVHVSDAIYVHKLAVRRRFARTGLAQHMIHWTATFAHQDNRSHVRLDCAADRPRLCQFYESLGFTKVGERVVEGIYPTAYYEAPVDCFFRV